VSGTFGRPGMVRVRLLGPVRDRSGSCQSVSWKNAPVAAHAPDLFVAADGTYRSAPVKVVVAGCYTFVETLVGASVPVVTTPPGLPTETFLVQRPAVVPGPTVAPPAPHAGTPRAALAHTGAPVRTVTIVGVVLALAGTALLAVARRRRSIT
jgi:LPXTG-motif cell wall-anchored protein